MTGIFVCGMLVALDAFRAVEFLCFLFYLSDDMAAPLQKAGRVEGMMDSVGSSASLRANTGTKNKSLGLFRSF